MSNIALFPTVYFIGKYILVLDRDTFRLELDYWSIIWRVNYPYFRIYISSLVMALIPVRMEILSLRLVA